MRIDLMVRHSAFIAGCFLILMSGCCLFSPQAGDIRVIEINDGISIEIVWVPEGKFTMGSPKSEEGRREDEGPQASVEVNGFWMGKYEVSQEQYQGIMGKNPSHFKGARNPVDNASWNDAMVFCKRVREMTGKQLSLPTEAQWEYACRGGSTHRFSFGDSEEDMEAYGWSILNSGRNSNPVGQKKPNAWGLYDMHGNVSEWCLSKYEDYPYVDDDGRNKVDESGDKRVLRGGCWSYLPWQCRSSSRFWLQPEMSNRYRGFRIVCVSQSAK